MQSLAERFFSAFHALQMLRVLFARHTNPPLPHGEFMVLNGLLDMSHGNGCARINVSALRGKRGMSLPAMSQMLRGLERKGLIVRTVSDVDRRHTLVTITDEGRAVVGQAQCAVNDVFEGIARELGEDKMEQLLELLEDFSGIVSRQVKEKTNEVNES